MMRNHLQARWLVLAGSAMAFGCGAEDEQGSSSTGLGARAPDVRGTIESHRPVANRLAQSLGSAAIRRVAELSGRPRGAFRIANAGVVAHELSGETGAHFKLADSEGKLYSVVLDAEGRPLDAAALTARERSLRATHYGRLHPRLHRVLSSSTPDAVKVAVWLKTEPQPEAPIPFSLSRSAAKLAVSVEALRPEVDGVHAELDRLRGANVEPVVREISARLAALGAPARSDRYTPLVHTELSRDALEVVGSWPEVAEIDLSADSAPELDIVRSVIRTQIVHSQGIRGQGVQAAVVEVNSGSIAAFNPFLAGITQDLSQGCPEGIFFHGTTIAGIIHSSSSTIRGVAPDSTLRFFPTCQGDDASSQNRSTAAADWGARIINLSWGNLIDSNLVLSANDRFYDSMVINRARVVVKSAGNRGDRLDGQVTSPGLAYNVITVGNFDDANTTGLGDDFMSGDSSWGDPISEHDDREKPEVVAPGIDLKSTSVSFPWFDDANDGTSFAAPQVVGVSALVMNVSAALQVRPETVKAVIMASAVQNLEGEPVLGERDGAGGINAEMAVRIARDNTRGNGWEGLAYDCSAPDVTTLFADFTVNKQTRVAIAWNSDPNYVDYQNQPNADLDLEIVAPDGSGVAASASFDNPYEIVDFRPTISGVHSIRISKFRCDLSPRRLGVAWLTR